MRRRTRRLLLSAALGACLLPAAAAGVGSAAERAAAVDYATVQVPSVARSAGAPRTVRLPFRADLLGASWQGAADAVELRVQGADGRWSRWVELHASEDGPDPGSVEGRSATARIGRAAARRTASSPVWVGAAVRVQVRQHEGEPFSAARVVAINATGTATRTERAATAARASAAWVLGAPSAEARPYVTGGIRSRAAWNAAAPRTGASYAEQLAGIVVHHTAGTNRYSCAQVPAVLRGIQRYHMQAQGWNDIGYNFLVDRCGGVWEGRAGGITRPVIGAHTSGFNTATSGIALIGTHGVVRPSVQARASLQRLVAWRSDLANVRPDAAMRLTARTGDKHPVGSTVTARAVSGHRDLFPTSCPGAMSYRELTWLARRAWALGGAKVANVTTTVQLRNAADPLDPTLARVAARAVGNHAEEYLAFRLERISTGELLHLDGGTGLVRQVRWEVPPELSVPAWDVRLVVNGARPGGDRARPATVPLQRAGEDPQLRIVTPPSPTVAPGGDPADDTVRLQYTLGLDYRLGATLHDAATGDVVATLLQPTYVGTSEEPADLELAIPQAVAAGSYELRVALPADPAAGRSVHRFPLTVVR